MLRRNSESAMASTADAAPKASLPGLRISDPNDSFEQEADRMADKVVRGEKVKPEWSLSNMVSVLRCSVSAPAEEKGNARSAGEIRESRGRRQDRRIQGKPCRSCKKF